MDGRTAESRTRVQVRPVPRQLPGPPPHFTGRLHDLDHLVDVVDQPGNAAVISAISGAGGIGKTSLALQWAHQHLLQFPDGQLFIDLRGFSPTGEPLPSIVVLTGFLGALGVPAAEIPVDLDAQIGLFRTLMTDRRMLIILDNAADTSQVVPLLPGVTSSTVLVTSRQHLTGLVITNGAKLVQLDALDEAEARELLASRIGSDRLDREPDAVDELVRYCGGLPLALAITTARAAIKPNFPLQVFVDELADVTTRLDALDDEESATGIRAVFSWSYQQLDADAAKLFRLLGLHPGTDISLLTTASLMDARVSTVRRLLHRLCAAHLTTHISPDRFSLHDLLHAYASELACTLDNAADRHRATARMLDHYLHCADLADGQLPIHRSTVPIETRYHPKLTPTLNGAAEAMAWFDTERANLIATTKIASEQGWLIHAWQLPYTVSRFFWLRSERELWLRSTEVALAAANRLLDADARFVTLFNHGMALLSFEQFDKSLSLQREALEIARSNGELHKQARALIGVASALRALDRRDEAESHYREAIAVSRSAGSEWTEANSNHQLALLYFTGDRYIDAKPLLRMTAQIYHRINELCGESACLVDLAFALLKTGVLDDALYTALTALTVACDAASPYHQGLAHAMLGTVLNKTNDTGAIEHWKRALEIFVDLSAPEADEVRDWLIRPELNKEDPRLLN